MRVAFLFPVVLIVAACSQNPVRKPVAADLSLKVDPRIVRSCEKFERVTLDGISEARLLQEYARLTNAYTDCYYNNEAWITLFKKELSNVK